MREILFRGKRLDNNDWIEGYYVKGESDNLSYIIPIENFYNGYRVVFDESVSQYTGLKDKNGTMIFEGDIVRYDKMFRKKEIGIINFRHATFWATWVGIDRETPFNRNFIGYVSDCLEVIGNMHDNPELLKQ